MGEWGEGGREGSAGGVGGGEQWGRGGGARRSSAPAAPEPRDPPFLMQIRACLCKSRGRAAPTSPAAHPRRWRCRNAPHPEQNKPRGVGTFLPSHDTVAGPLKKGEGL